MGEAAPDRRSRAGSLGLSRARTVRDATFDVLRRRGLTTLFANPGSTEVPFLAGLPDDLRFVLALHEGSVVGLATGFAIARGEPALAILHTTAGLGNAVGAIATARVNRAPLVVLVGQQDRRHLVFEPFLAGRLDGLAGEYPLSVEQPVRPQEVPGAVERAWHTAAVGRGPALVIVPMDDWDADGRGVARTRRRGACCVPRRSIRLRSSELAAFLAGASAPALVVGAGADDAETWAALVVARGAARRAGVPGVVRRARRLSAGPRAVRRLPAGRPAAFARAARAVRRDPGRRRARVPAVAVRARPLHVIRGTRIALVSDDVDEVRRSPVELALLAPPAAVCRELAALVPARDVAPPRAVPRPPAPPRRRGPGEPLLGGSRLRGARGTPAARGGRRRGGARRPAGAARPTAPRASRSASSAPPWAGSASRSRGATGVRMALPQRPVVAVVGDGSSVYGIQALWSAAHYGVGVLFVDPLERRLRDHGSARRAARRGAAVAVVRHRRRCARASIRLPGARIETHEELVGALDERVPTLADARRAGAPRRRDRADADVRPVDAAR